MSDNLASQAIAATYLERWGGDGVQKEAFFGKQVGKRMGGEAIGGLLRKGISKTMGSAEPGAMSGVRGYFGNTASGVASGSAGQKAFSGLRSAMGAKGGQKLFEKPTHYITRPLRGAIMPNLGKPLNYARGTALGLFGANQAHKGYEALGEGANTVRELAETAQDLGMSPNVVNDLNRYGSRWGVAKGWLRGHGVPGGMLGDKSTSFRQQMMDELVSRGSDDAMFSHMSHSMGSGIKAHEILNPIGALFTRGTLKEVGDVGVSETGGGWTEKLQELAGMSGDDRRAAAVGLLGQAREGLQQNLQELMPGGTQKVPSFWPGSDKWRTPLTQFANLDTTTTLSKGPIPKAELNLKVNPTAQGLRTGLGAGKSLFDASRKMDKAIDGNKTPSSRIRGLRETFAPELQKFRSLTHNNATQ